MFQNMRWRCVKVKRTIKKSFAAILCVMMLLTAAPLDGFVGLHFPELRLPSFSSFFAPKAQAADPTSGTCGDNLTWDYDTKTQTLTIGGTGAMNNYSWDSYSFGSVTTAPWKSYYNTMKALVINSGVTSIGSFAFYNCYGLTDVTISDSITSISSYAFYGCTGLTSVTIPTGVTSIGNRAFCNCTGLKEINYNAESISDFNTASNIFYKAGQESSGITVVVGKTVDRVPAYLFYTETIISSPNIETVIIGENVTSIGARAFCNCTSLTSVTIPDSVTSIGNAAFYGVSKVIYNGSAEGSPWGANNAYGHFEYPLYYFDSSKSNLMLCDSSFDGEITIPDSVTSIGSYAFNDCTGLTSVTIPDSVTSIGSSAFRGCAGLTSVIIPDSVTSIGNDAFRSCNRLTSVYITDLESWCKISLGNSLSNPLYYAHNLYLNDELVTDLIIPNKFTKINAFVFYNCTALTSVTIPESATSIGSYAFSGCAGLTRVTIPDSVTSIGEYAFRNCAGLTSVTIPDGVTSIDRQTFVNCSNLKEIHIPYSVTTFGNDAFGNCDSITDIYYSGSNTQWSSINFNNNTILKNAVDYDLYYGSTDHAWIHFTEYFKIKYYSEGELINYVSLKAGASIPDFSPEARTGYTFLGWQWSTSNGTKPAAMLSRNIDATAEWQIHRHTITFNTGGGSSIPSITQDYGTAVTAPGDPVREGYTFEGWNNTIPKTMPDEDLTITAKWKINRYTISFVTVGGTAIAPITADYGTVITPPADPMRVGYTFTGWNKTIPKTMPAENVIVTALWHINSHTITFDTAGGSDIADITQNYGTNVNAPDDPVRDGYTFAGWDKDIPRTMPDEDILIKAKWIKNYSVVFNTNGGTSIPAFTAIPGTAVPLPADPTREGYTFAGWDRSIPETVQEGNVTVNANWTINKYKLTYLDDNGSTLKTLTLNYNSSISAYTPSRTGYTFKGWDKNVPATMPAHDLTLTAVWKVNAYTITFNSNGGSEVPAITANYGEAITPPVNPTREGYTFSKWSSSVPKTMPAYNQTLTAQWTVNSYTITYYDPIGKTTLSTATKNYGTTISLPSNPTKAGYRFSGWVWPDGKDAKPATMPAYNVKVYAIWTVNDGAHSGHNIIVYGATAPTCTENGKSGASFCETCDKGIDSGYVLPAYGHDYVSKTTLEATCTETGTLTSVCNKCKDVKTETIPAKGHKRTSEQVTLEPTCTKEGVNTITCFCGYSWNEPIEMIPHDYNVVYTPPTCEDDGLRAMTCKKCGHYEERVVKANGHEYVKDNAVAATCEKDGHTLKEYCKNCGKVLTESTVIPALGHNYKRTDIKTATCTEDGTYKKVCQRCGSTEKGADGSTLIYTVEALGHDYAQITTVESTCQSTGTYVKRCKRCSEYLKGETPVYQSVRADRSLYPETPHSYGNSQEYNYTFSYPDTRKITLKFSDKCKFENGYDYLYLYDGNGSQIGKYTDLDLRSKEVVINGDSFSIKVTTDHSTAYYGFSFDSIYVETDTSIQKFVKPKSDHRFIETVAKPATPLETGLLTCICSVCGESETRVIPKTLYAVGEVITYGSYPQSKVIDKDLLAELNRQPATWKSYGYYVGNCYVANGSMTPSDFMRYTDVTYNGEKYRGVTFSGYRVFATGGTSPVLGNYSFQDDWGYYPNHVYWFKYDPMQWRILDPTKGLVVAEKAIDSQPFSNFVINSWGTYFGNSGKTYYANDYAKSSIRTWLNNDFLNTVFSSEQKANVLSTQITSLNYETLSGSRKSSPFDSASTNDKVFLLSYDEILNEIDYGFDISPEASDTRQATATDYARCQGIGGWEPYEHVAWYLRTSANSSDTVCLVAPDGSVDPDNANEKNYVALTVMGIRPALRLSNITATGGASSSGEVYTVTYKVGNNTFATLSVRKGDPVVSLDPGDRAGYEFSGWGEPEEMPNGNIVLKGEYLPVYKARFVADGVTVGEVEYTTATTAIIEPAVPEKAGKIGSWEEYTFKAGGITVRAVYEDNPCDHVDADNDGKCDNCEQTMTYTVSYNANGGSGAPADQTKTHGKALSLSSAKPSKTGYTFTGWNTKADGSGTGYAAGADYTTEADMTLYAQWTANTYTVKYNGNGSTSGSTASSSHTYDVEKALTANGFKRSYTVTYNYNYTGASNTTATANYTFGGWNTKADGSGMSYSDKQKLKNLTADNGATVDLYAKWTAAAVTLPSPSRDGFTFTGWNTKVDGSGTGYAAGASFTPDGNITLYAQWIQIVPDEFTLTYNANGGSGAPAPQTGSGSVTLSSAKPTRSGYTFLGWATSSTATSAQYQPGESFSLTKNTTLYAVWQKNGETPSQGKLRSVAVDDTTVNWKSSVTLKPTIDADEGVKTTVTYSSSDPSVASVDASGKVSGLKRGTATITCSVTDEAGSTVKDTCKVTVKYTFVQWLIKIFLLGFIWYN